MSDNQNMLVTGEEDDNLEQPEKMIAVDQTSEDKPQNKRLLVRFRITNSKTDVHAIHQNSINITGNVEKSPKDLTLKPKRAIRRKHFDDETTDRSEMHMKKKTITFSIALTKEETEKDILAMIGGTKLPRNPSKKKRPTKVQRNLDMAFPGLGLSSITPATYKLR